MIPYVTIPPVAIGPLAINAFRTLVLLGVVVSYLVFLRRADRQGIARQQAKSFFVAGLLSAFLMAHVGKLVLYSPGLLATDPLSLLRPFDGLSSFGGVAGACAGARIWQKITHYPGRKFPELIDAALYAFPFGWLPGRLACAVSHDHLGRLTDHWLGVQYPGGMRWNLGMLEALFIAGLAALFWRLGRRPRPRWFFGALFCLSYAPFRFLLDSLHESAPRLAFNLSVDQTCSLALAAMGIIYIAVTRRTDRWTHHGVIS